MKLIGDSNQTYGGQSENVRKNKKTETGYSNRERKEQDPKPENLLNDRTSHGLVPFAVPCSPHTLIRSRTWPWHLEMEL